MSISVRPPAGTSEVATAHLRSIPLLRSISDAHLTQLVGAFERFHIGEGDVLFEAGSAPTHFLLLVAGEVSLFEGDVVRFRLRPIAPIGELGSITGLRRNTTAKATSPAEIWRIEAPSLMKFFEAHGDVAFPFHYNLLKLSADKIRRDDKRLNEMRANVIRTQKAMKRLREIVLEAPETSLSKPIFETLDALIQQNRKSHYLVSPSESFLAHVRTDDGLKVSVRELSDTMLRMEHAPDPVPALRSHWSAVLVTPDCELPVSGSVEDVTDGMLVQLDPFIDEYAQRLEDYLTRVQMTDYVV
jgi:CRP/FNR family transcriptional regulator, cyclic AMP receptor protein